MASRLTISLLVSLSLSSWMLYIAILQIPSVGNKLPSLRIKSRATPPVIVKIPASQVLVMMIALFNIIAFSILYSVVAKGTLLLKQIVTFLISSFFMISGVSMHTVAVIVENQLTDNDTVFPLIDVLHEYVSHSTAMIGFYLMISTIVWEEYRHFLRIIQDGKGMNELKHKWFTLLTALIEWPFSVVLGQFIAVFSLRTSTHLITFLFFFIFVLFAFKLYKELQSFGVSMFQSGYFRCEILLTSFFFIVSLSGLFHGLLVLIGSDWNSNNEL
uniref:Uncharacterized protein n=1 Tax=Amphimedon queenslandica TaxID=400682 RepID=A0A1X7UZE9_AMPQE